MFPGELYLSMQITEQEAEEKKAVETRKAEYSKWSLAGYCADVSEQMGKKLNKLQIELHD